MAAPMKRILASLLAVAVATAPTLARPADLNAEMQAMFNDLGALGNVTAPGAFRGQAMNLYTGGSFMMRSPGRNYSLADVQLPSLRAGCGGIDLFGGSFSFINKQQFVALLRNIGSNAVGYAFKLALQSISPDIDWATEVTATTRRPRFRAPRASSTGTAVRPLAEKTSITSRGPKLKFERMTSARPGVRSMNMAWRWPLAPTTCVWKVIESSTSGAKPGYEP